MRTIYQRVFIFHMLIGLDKDMTRIEIIRSKVKVRRITFVKKTFPVIILKTVYHTAFIHVLIGHGEGLIPINFVFFTSRVKSQGSLL